MIPPEIFWSDQLSAAIFEIKLPSESRTIEYTVIEFPETTDCAGTIVPVPFAAVSIPIVAGAPGVTAKLLLVPVSVPDVCVAVMVNVPVLMIVTGRGVRTPFTNGAVVPPPADKFPDEEMFTVPLKLVTTFPAVSSASRVSVNGVPAICVLIGILPIPVTRNVFNGPGEIVKILLAADTSPELEAVSCFDPVRLMLRLSNVAIPLVVVVRVNVPVSMPVPEEIESVMESPDVSTILPSESRTCTVTDGVIVDPDVVFTGS